MEGDDELVAKFELLMGPRFCKRGNHPAQRSALEIRHLLQWGHAFVSVETAAACRAGRSARGASMGPRFCKRGNGDTGTIPRPRARVLQWGHAFVSVETSVRIYGECAACNCFNGATLL